MKTLTELMLQPPVMTSGDVARVLTKQTKRPVSRRSVQSWLTLPDNPSYRPVPKWALLILAAYRCKH